jgi:hypothetical protein
MGRFKEGISDFPAPATAGEGELFDGVITLDNTPLEHK